VFALTLLSDTRISHCEKKLARLLYDSGISSTQRTMTVNNRFWPSRTVYYSWQHLGCDDRRAWLTRAVVWREVEQEAALIFEHILFESWNQWQLVHIKVVNRVILNHHYPFIGTLKPHSNEPLHSSTVIGTLAVDGWAVTFGTAKRRLGGLWPVYRWPVSCLPVKCP